MDTKPLGFPVDYGQIDWKQSPHIFKVSQAGAERFSKPKVPLFASGGTYAQIFPAGRIKVEEKLTIGKNEDVRAVVSFWLTLLRTEGGYARYAFACTRDKSIGLQLNALIVSSMATSKETLDDLLDGRRLPASAVESLQLNVARLGLSIEVDTLQVRLIPWIDSAASQKLVVDRGAGMTVSSSDGMNKKQDLHWKCILEPDVRLAHPDTRLPVYRKAWYLNRRPFKVAQNTSAEVGIETLMSRFVFEQLDHKYSEHQLRTDLATIEQEVAAVVQRYALGSFGLNARFTLMSKDASAEVLSDTFSTRLEQSIAGTDEGLTLEIVVDYTYKIDNIARFEVCPVKDQLVEFIDDSINRELRAQLLKMDFEEKVGLLIPDRTAESKLSAGLDAGLYELLQPYGVSISSHIATIKSPLITSLTESKIDVRTGERKYSLSRLTYVATFGMVFSVALRDRSAAAKLVANLSDQSTLKETLAGVGRDVIRNTFSGTPPNEYLAATSGRQNSLPNRLVHGLESVLAGDFGLKLVGQPDFQFSDDELSRQLSQIASLQFRVKWDDQVVTQVNGSKVPISCVIEGRIEGMADDGDPAEWSEENERLWTRFWNKAQRMSAREQVNEFEEAVKSKLTTLFAETQAEHYVASNRAEWAPRIRALVIDRAYEHSLKVALHDHDIRVLLDDEYRQETIADNTRLKRLESQRKALQEILDDMEFSVDDGQLASNNKWFMEETTADSTDDKKKEIRGKLRKLAMAIEKERAGIQRAVSPLALDDQASAEDV